MATKKRLADLVREEVKKQSEDGTSATESAPTNATKKNAPKASASTKRQSARTAAKKTATQAKKSPAASETTALKAKLATLEKENKSLQSDNAKLLTKVESLEQTLAQSKATEKELKTAQSKQKSMQLTLDEAKQDALKLAQENQKLLDKIEVLETQAPKSAAIAQRQPKTARPVRAASHAIQRSSTRQSPVVYKAPAKKPFSRPIAPSRLPTRRVVQNSDEFETWCYD